MFASIIATLLFSFSVVFGHRSAKLIGGAEANFWRLVAAMLLLGTWSFVFERGLEGTGLGLFLLSGLAGIGVGDVAFFQALPRLGSRLSVLLTNCLTAPFAALIEWWWLGTGLSGVQIAAGLVTLTGVGIALAPGDRLRLTRQEILAGAGLSVVSALGGAVGAVLSRKAYAVTLASGEHLSGPNAAFQRVAGGIILAGIFLLWTKRKALRLQAHAPRELVRQASRNKWRAAWPWITLNALAGLTLGVSFMQWALETTPTGLVLATVALTPIAVIPLAIVFEGEKPDRHSLAGGALAVAGVIALSCFR